jgi:hypothetical protein
LKKGIIVMELLLVALGATGFIALVDLAALRWGKDSRDTGDVPEYLHRHPRASI